MTPEPLSVSRKEAARLLGYSTKTIDRLCERGELRKARQGGRSMVEYASIKAYHARLFDRPRERPTATQMRAAWLPELDDRPRRRGAAA